MKRCRRCRWEGWPDLPFRLPLEAEVLDPCSDPPIPDWPSGWPSWAAATYRELQRQGRAWLASPQGRRRVDRTRREIQELGPSAAVAFSGGKDSLALLDLADGLPAFFIDDGCQTPWCYQVVEAMRRRGRRILAVPALRSMPALAAEVGTLGYQGELRRPGEWHWGRGAIRWYVVREPARHVTLTHGWQVHLLGLRAGESARRERIVRYLGGGDGQYRVDGYTVAMPLRYWSAEEVLWYCAGRGLPLCPVYLVPGDADRGRRRVAPVLLEQAARAGDWNLLRQLLPGWWGRVTALFPDISLRS